MSFVENYRTDRQVHRQQQMTFLTKAAELHLDRVTTLSNREWQTKIVYWGALLASGATLIGSASRANPALANAIAHWDFLILIAYYGSATVYLFGYSGNMHQSLVTERNRYQLLQDAAARLSNRNTPFLIQPSVLIFEGKFTWWNKRTVEPDKVYRPIARRQLIFSGVWGVKVVSTALFITSIWTVSQLTAHVQYVAATHRQAVCETYQQQHPALDRANTSFDCDRVASWHPLPNGAIVLRCAFMICEDQPRPALTDVNRMEWGTLLAIGFGLLFMVAGLFAWIASPGP